MANKSAHIVTITSTITKTEKYLQCKDTENCENYDVKDNGSDVINHYVKDYPDHKGTREVGKIVKERCFPNDDEDDSYDIVEEYD